MKIYITVEAEVNEKVFEDLKKLHEKEEYTVGTAEQYEQAIRAVEKIVNLPFYDNAEQGKLCISTVCDAENETIILE